MRVFVSYSSADRSQIRPIVDFLKAEGIEVWWDRDLEASQNWGTIIERELAQADRVLGFLTPNVLQSKTDYVFVEFRQARLQNKLEAVVIDDARNFEFEGLIARVQSHGFDSFDSVLKDEVFAGRWQRGTAKAVVGSSGDASQRVEEWVTSIEEKLDPDGQVAAISLAFCLALFEGERFSVIEEAGNILTHQISNKVSGKQFELPASFPRRRMPKVNLIEAFIVNEGLPNLQHEVVRFQDRERATAFLHFTWVEFGSWRRPLIELFETIVDQINNSEAMRMGLALGTLAQPCIDEMFDGFLFDWLRSKSRRKQLVADTVISVAVFAPAAEKRVRELVKNWASSDSVEHQKVAIRLACGYLGARVPDLAFDTIQRIGSSDAPIRNELLGVMSQSLDSLLQHHLKSADDSLFGLNSFLTQMAKWVLETDTKTLSLRKSKENPWPILLVLLILDGVPLGTAKESSKRFSLASIIMNPQLLETLADVLQFALERPNVKGLRVRKIASKVLETWVKSHKLNPDDENDALLLLAQKMYHKAPTKNDKDRLIHLFRSVYSADQIDRPSKLQELQNVEENI